MMMKTTHLLLLVLAICGPTLPLASADVTFAQVFTWVSATDCSGDNFLEVAVKSGSKSFSTDGDITFDGTDVTVFGNALTAGANACTDLSGASMVKSASFQVFTVPDATAATFYTIYQDGNCGGSAFAGYWVVCDTTCKSSPYGSFQTFCNNPDNIAIYKTSNTTACAGGFATTLDSTVPCEPKGSISFKTLALGTAASPPAGAGSGGGSVSSSSSLAPSSSFQAAAVAVAALFGLVLLL